MGVLGQTEQFILLALARLGDEAYGVTVRHEIEARAGHTVSIAAVYAGLDRLERGGLVEGALSDPTPERGGRAKKYFRLTRQGVVALEATRRAMDAMWDGVDLRDGANRQVRGPAS